MIERNTNFWKADGLHSRLLVQLGGVVHYMLHTNYFINRNIIGVSCQKVNPHMSKAHCGYTYFHKNVITIHHPANTNTTAINTTRPVLAISKSDWSYLSTFTTLSWGPTVTYSLPRNWFVQWPQTKMIESSTSNGQDETNVNIH